MTDSEELLALQREVSMLKESANGHKDEAIMILALIQALKIRGEDWPESLINNTLKSIDIAAWAIGSHLQDCYSGETEESIQENLDSIETMINED
jgi:hypothetical protein